MSPQRVELNLLVSFLLFVSAIDASSIRATQCPAFRLSSILSNHKYHLPVQSGFQVKSPKSSHEEKIVGGQETSPNQFPFMVFTESYYFDGQVRRCGGTLISSRWILTAAHCTVGALKMTVTMGAHDVSPGSTDQHQLTYTLDLYTDNTQSIIYPEYYYGNVEDDISLIKLPQDVPLNQWIQPARLPYSDDPKQVGDSVVMAGWGNFSNVVDSGLSPTLRQVNTTVIPYTTCRQQAAGVGTFTDEKIICGDGAQGAHYCYGDDGGPMIDYREDEQESFVIGVASFGDISCQSSTKPNLYTRVSNYVNWIHNETGIPPIELKTTTTQRITTTSTEDPNLFSCKNKENGLYPVPDVTCTQYFYFCTNGFSFLFDCVIDGTIFYYDMCACDYPENVPGCSGYTMGNNRK